MAELFANDATTTLAGAISDVALTATLSPGTGARFPNPTGGDFFRMTFRDALTTLNNEIVYVTARAGDVITMQRGQEGTVAQNWLANDLAANLWTAGAAANILQAAQQLPGRLIGQQRFSTAGTHTYTPTPGTSFVIVQLVGGGAGGSGAQATSASQYCTGGGGGSGAFSIGRFTDIQIGASQTVTIGAGGGGGSFGNGGPGGASSFGALMSCPGGLAGTFQVSAAANTEFGRGFGGSAGTGGYYNVPGTQGQSGYAFSLTGSGGAGGGSPMFGGTGGGVRSPVNNGGNAATAPGAGGGGATNTPSNANNVGGVGAAGAIEIWEFS